MEKFFFIIIAILILLLMITIHEFGHYLAGKLLGFKIDEFSIGFGPKLFSKKKKNGEVFSIRLLPLGGFCAFAGETEEENILAPEKMKDKDVFELESDDSEKLSEDAKPQRTWLNFNEQAPWKRIIVLMAGGVFNLLSAVIFSFIFIVSVGSGTPNVVTVYDSVEPSVQCALVEGDKILSVDGTKIDFSHTLAEALAGKCNGDEIEVVILRDGEKISLTTTIRNYKTSDELTEEDVYPVGMGVGLVYDKATLGDAFKYCVPYTAKLSWLILGTFGDLFTGDVPISEVAGPIGTVNQIANLGMQSWSYILLLLPLIAANLGIFNLFPIPALDGAKVIFTVVEWIRGKPINQKVEGMIHFVGLIVLFGLVIILDIVNLISGIF